MPLRRVLVAAVREFRRNLSATPSKSLNCRLLKILDSEIKYANNDLNELPNFRKDFLFKIEDKKGKNSIGLKRSYQNESINVVVSMPKVKIGTSEEGRECSIGLRVNIGKTERLVLELCCTAFPDEIEIDNATLVSFRDERDEVGGLCRHSFKYKDKNLQQALREFLDQRGISPVTINLFYEYMISKDNREYLFWLQNIRKFVEK